MLCSNYVRNAAFKRNLLTAYAIQSKPAEEDIGRAQSNKLFLKLTT